MVAQTPARPAPKAAVQAAVDDLRAAYGDNQVLVEPDGEGGAYVTVLGQELGEGFEPPTTWVGFRITFQYPNADIYPHYVDPELKFTASRQPLSGGGIGRAAFNKRPAIQLSRRSKRRDPTVDTARRKLVRVIHWLRSRAWPPGPCTCPSHTGSSCTATCSLGMAMSTLR